MAKVFESREFGVQTRNKRSNLKRHVNSVHKGNDNNREPTDIVGNEESCSGR